MAKVTRKSFRRQRIILGISLFASIALISTGFAAWVISSQAEHKEEGNIQIGDVNDNSIKIENVTLSIEDFKFEPKQDDTTGRVRNDGANFEQLKLTVTGTITPKEYVQGATISLTVPESVKTAAGDQKQYIVLPECAKSAQPLTLDDTGAFSYDIEFTWGEAFNNMNPGLYYDTDPEGSAVTDQDMKATLTDLKTAMYGENQELKFTINIKADNN